MAMMRTRIRALWFLFIFLVTPLSKAFALSAHPDSWLVQFGAFQGHQGASQAVPIVGLIGNQYTLRHHRQTRPLVGLGYLITGHQTERVTFQYGVNAFYLLRSAVSGRVIQENLFENLAYQYRISNLPVYAIGKLNFFPNKTHRLGFTAEAGIGPNFMHTSQYQETSLNGISLPDNAFLGRSRTLLSGMAGVGFRINNAFGTVPLELGYRFMYLGKSALNRRTDQLESNLRTGNVNAQAVILTFIFE